MIKWYNGDGFFATTLAVSDPFKAWDRDAKLESRITAAVKESTKVAESVRINYEDKIAELKQEVIRMKEEKKTREEEQVKNPKKRTRSQTFQSTMIDVHERKIWRKYFDEVDVDLNGEITKEELKTYMGKLTPPVYLHDSIVQSMIDEADADHNGVISLDEFILMMYVADKNMAKNIAWQTLRGRITNEMHEAAPRFRGNKRGKI